ncbi:MULTISPECIES: PIN domain-containing protein [Sphingobacterium]|uniref:PIN domain-containing protein n=1 Tax=Sphingobacterium TaxID=28453 RepID=UPI0025799697|nr:MULTISPECIES: PIN domain-containing protein [Sphingobacterium]
MFLVLIDTSAYEDARLAFNGPIFDSLIKLSDDRKLVIIGSEILNREMETHLNESIISSVNQLKQVYGKLDRLTKDDLISLSGSTLYDKALKKRLYEDRKKRMYDFFDAVKYELLDLSYAKVDVIFNDYFNIRPPFGEGNKKSEFPDAFVLNSFIHSYDENLANTCIVSKDSDWEEYIKGYPEVRFFSRIPDLIDFINTNYDAELTKRLMELLNFKTAELGFAIKQAVRDDLFEVDDSWIDPEVELEFPSLEVEILDFNIISVTPELAQVEVVVNFKFSLLVWAKDDETATKDSDTKDWYYFGTNQFSVEVEKTLPVAISISYYPHPEDFSDTFDIESIDISPDLYYISSEDHEFSLGKHWSEEY